MAGNVLVVLLVIAVSVAIVLLNDRYRASLPPDEEAAARARDRRACIVVGSVLGTVVAFGAFLDFVDA